MATPLKLQSINHELLIIEMNIYTNIQKVLAKLVTLYSQIKPAKPVPLVSDMRIVTYLLYIIVVL